MYYIIRKLFPNLRLTSRLCNSKYGITQEIEKYFYVLYGVAEEHIELQKEIVLLMSCLSPTFQKRPKSTTKSTRAQ